MSVSPPPQKQLFLIDGYGYVFRAYHVMPPLTRPADGTPVGAVYGFANMLLRLLERLKSHIANHETYLAVILDAGQKNFRHDLDTRYKANRPPAPEDLIPQFPLIREVAEAFNVRAVEKGGYEADDVIATYAKQASAEGMKVTIVSSDKDLMQLVDDKVEMYDPVKDKRIGIAEVREKFGVLPPQVQDVLALMGDSSDNVPGVPGIGPKTAAELITQYGTLENLYEHVGEIKQAKRKETLINARDDAFLSKKLVGLCEDVSDIAPVSALEYQALDQQKLVTFLDAQGFSSLVKRLQKEWGVTPARQEGSAVTHEVHAAKPKPALNTTEVKYAEELVQWIKTSKLPETKAALVVSANAVAVAVSDHQAAVMPLSVSTPVIRDLLDFGTPEVAGPEAVLKTLAAALNGVLIVGYQMKEWLKLMPDITAQDVELMLYALQGSGKHDPFGDASGEGERAARLYELHDELQQQIFEKALNNIYYRVDQPVQYVLAAMEQKGIKIDVPFLRDLSNKFGTQMAVLEKEIHLQAKGEFNIGSPKQLGEVLFDRLGLPGGRKNKKTGAYSTDADVLEELIEQGHDIAAKVLEWRGLSKLKSTYTDTLPLSLNTKTARVHTTFNLASTTTGRLSSEGPNLQNIPIRTQEGRQIRNAFIAENDNVLISADYSQIELRLLAHVADIAPLKTAFKNGIDIHTQTASQVFGIPTAEVTGDMRRSAKAINFGIIYGQSAFGLAGGLGISREQAGNYIKAYFQQFPGIQRYMEETKEFAREHGYVETLLGRKCYTPYIHDKIPARRQFAERAAINAPLQGTAADIIKRAMIRLQQKLQGTGSALLLQVHDELVIEAPAGQAEQVAGVVKRTMESAISLTVPLSVDVSIGKNWGKS